MKCTSNFDKHGSWCRTIIPIDMLWLNFILGLNFIFFCFKLIIIHYHTQKQKKIKFKPRIKFNHNRYIHQLRRLNARQVLDKRCPDISETPTIYKWIQGGIGIKYGS